MISTTSVAFLHIERTLSYCSKVGKALLIDYDTELRLLGYLRRVHQVTSLTYTLSPMQQRCSAVARLCPCQSIQRQAKFYFTNQQSGHPKRISTSASTRTGWCRRSRHTDTRHSFTLIDQRRRNPPFLLPSIFSSCFRCIARPFHACH